ncbi:hypothetical protein C790_02002 [Morganella morganii SC01]|nr:hypothetical protein C790_02002 [Morganella morganii SC01]
MASRNASRSWRESDVCMSAASVSQSEKTGITEYENQAARAF